jgi:hypothetical protein
MEMLDRIVEGLVGRRSSPEQIRVNVLIVGPLERGDVEHWLQGVPPQVWSFRFGKAVEDVNWHRWHGWHDVPFPLEDQTLVVFSATDHPVTGIAGGCAGTRYTVAVFGTETDEVLMLRCWHELLHGLPGIESADAMCDSAAFRAFLETNYPVVHTAFIADVERYRHDPRPQRLFYTMLTNQFAERRGLAGVPLPPEPTLE